MSAKIVLWNVGQMNCALPLKSHWGFVHDGERYIQTI